MKRGVNLPGEHAGLEDGGAPARLLNWLAAHPESHIRAAIEALGLKVSTGYYALARLRDLHLVKPDREQFQMARWSVADSAETAPRPRRGPRNGEAVMNYRTLVAPTGTPIEHAGVVQVLRVAGPRLDEPAPPGRRHQHQENQAKHRGGWS